MQTLALASLVDSASAAIARCIWTGRRTSLLQLHQPRIVLLIKWTHKML